jgi:hypothetical protein
MPFGMIWNKANNPVGVAGFKMDYGERGVSFKVKLQAWKRSDGRALKIGFQETGEMGVL